MCKQAAAAQKRKREEEHQAALPYIRQERAEQRKRAKLEQDTRDKQHAELFMRPWTAPRTVPPTARGGSGMCHCKHNDLAHCSSLCLVVVRCCTEYGCALSISARVSELCTALLADSVGTGCTIASMPLSQYC